MFIYYKKSCVDHDCFNCVYRQLHFARALFVHSKLYPTLFEARETVCMMTVQVVIVVTQENAMLLSCRSQKSPIVPPLGPTPAQKARIRALNIDRFSRVFFPFLFAVLNVTYWIMFAEYIQTLDIENTDRGICAILQEEQEQGYEFCEKLTLWKH